MKYCLSLALVSIFFAILPALLYMNKDKNLEKVEQGSASKIFYQNHSYVVWSINSGGGIVHDPDCRCNSE